MLCLRRAHQHQQATNQSWCMGRALTHTIRYPYKAQEYSIHNSIINNHHLKPYHPISFTIFAPSLLSYHTPATLDCYHILLYMAIPIPYLSAPLCM